MLVQVRAPLPPSFAMLFRLSTSPCVLALEIASCVRRETQHIATPEEVNMLKESTLRIRSYALGG